jgi:peptidoglycan/xylan/chitin deacetylase (PgdA/CDA1 family)
MRPNGDRRVRIFDLLVLYYHYLKFVELHGNTDAFRTERQLEEKLEHGVYIPPWVLENLLYSVNMLNEEGKFWHPKGEPFNVFLKKVCREARFNKVYNLLRFPDKDGGESAE